MFFGELSFALPWRGKVASIARGGMRDGVGSNPRRKRYPTPIAHYHSQSTLPLQGRWARARLAR